MSLNGRFRRLIGWFIVLSCFALLIPHAAAAPGPAVEVYVGGVELDAATPYYQNGSSTAFASSPAGGWNAYFDAAAATLKLQNIEITDLTFLQGSTTEKSFIEIYGNAALELIGDNKLLFVGSPAAGPDFAYGVYVYGDLSVRGSGSLSIAIQSKNSVYGMYSLYGLYFYDGSMTLRLQSSVSRGIVATVVIIDGAQIDVGVEGVECFGVSGEDLTLKSGTLDVNVESTYSFAYGVVAIALSLQGGRMETDAFGTGETCGLYYQDGTLEASGGQFVMSGETSAIAHGKNGTDIQSPAAGMEIFVSADRAGSIKTQWFSPADGSLTYANGTPSPFLYVEFSPIYPQTGDGRTPVLWAGIALGILFLAAGTFFAAGRRKSC